MNYFKILLSKIKNFFASGKALAMAQRAFEIAPVALPIIKQVADIATGLTPTKIDDVVWASVKAKFPHFFDGSLKTEQEIKAALGGIAAAKLKELFPEDADRVIDLAVQAAYIKFKDRPVTV